MTIIAFTVPGEARGWARARLGKLANGKPMHFMDSKTRSFEAVVKMAGAAAMAGRSPIDVPVVMNLIVRRVPPKTSKVKLAAMLADLLRPGTKPDASNVAKAVEDGLNKVVYVDDALVVRLVVDKVYATTPGVDVTITPYSGAA